jgi:hypothetical protein
MVRSLQSLGGLPGLFVLNIVCHFINTNQHITLVRLKLNGPIDARTDKGMGSLSVEHGRSSKGGSHRQRQVPEPVLRHPRKQGIGGGRGAGPESGAPHAIAVAHSANPDVSLQASHPKHPGAHQPELDRATGESLANRKIKIDIQTRYSLFIISYLLSRQN